MFDTGQSGATEAAENRTCITDSKNGIVIWFNLSTFSALRLSTCSLVGITGGSTSEPKSSGSTQRFALPVLVSTAGGATSFSHVESIARLYARDEERTKRPGVSR